jgi:hypothetical protein
MRATYRDENEGLRLQIDALLERYREQSDGLAEPLRLLYVRRSARMLAGKVATFGIGLLALLAAFNMIWTESFVLSRKPEHTLFAAGRGGLSLLLLALLVTVLVAYQAGRLLARGELTAKLARAIPRTGDAHRDLAELEAASPDLELRRLLAEQERRSIAFPLVGALALLPIALHFAVYLLFYALPVGVADPLAAFDDWIGLSVVLVTHAQLVTAYMGSRLARQLEERVASGERLPATRAGLAVFFAAAASLVPGALLAMIPPIIVAVTGAAVVIPAFHVARQRFLAERAILAV